MADDRKFDPFKPQQPAIPGVPAQVPKKDFDPASLPELPPLPTVGPPKSPFLWLGIAALVVVVGACVFWWAHGSSANTAAPAPVVEAPAEPAARPLKRVEPLPIGPGEIATTDELSRTWSAKKFIYRNPYTGEDLPSVVVRVPGGSFWAISLREPYGSCQLEYVTDLEKLRTQYHFDAEHPMVVNPCSRIIYDLARYANGPNGLVRGAVVRGAGVRPPFGIEIQTEGKNIVAVRIENTR